MFNTLNGDSNVAFFKEYKNLGLTAEAMPVLSVSIAEEEVGGIGVDNIVGQPVAWNYYQTLQSPANQKFVADFKAKYGADKVTSDPMEAAYTSLYLWKGMVEKANSFAVPDVQAAAGGVSFDGARGHGHGERRQPPHRQDRVDRQDRAGRADLHRLDVGRADRARPVPEELPLGVRPGQLRDRLVSGEPCSSTARRSRA